MVLITVSAKVEKEIWEKLPSGDRSEIIRKFCKDYVASLEGNLEDINLEILANEINSLRNQLIKASTELQSKETKMNQLKELHERKHQDQLKADKERLERSNRCLCCKQIIQEFEKPKCKIFNKGIVHYGCFLGAKAEDIRFWSMEET